MNERLYPFKLCTLNDCNGDLTKRWYISFYVWDVQKNKLVRKRTYDVNNYNTSDERYAYFKKEKSEVDTILKEGYHIDRSKQEYQPQAIINRVSLKEALDDVLKIKKASLRSGSYNSYNSSKNIFLKWAKDNNMDNYDVRFFDKLKARMFIDYLMVTKGISGKTINDGYVAQLKSIFEELVLRKVLKENPFSGLKKVREEESIRNRAFEDEHIKSLRKLIIKADKELWLFIQFIYYCFIRPNELRQLKVEDIDLENNSIEISGNISKNKKASSVTIPPDLKAILLKSIDFTDKKKFIFEGIKNQPISKNRMTARHKKYLETLNLQSDYTLYSWKHTGVVKAYKAGIKIKSIQRQCRHLSLEQTDNYLKSLNLYKNEEFLIMMPKI